MIKSKKNKFSAKKMCLVFGSEGKGMRNLVKKECDDIKNNTNATK